MVVIETFFYKNIYFSSLVILVKYKYIPSFAKLWIYQYTDQYKSANFTQQKTGVSQIQEVAVKMSVMKFVRQKS